MYKAIIDLRIEVHQFKDGVCSGMIVPESEMNDYGLKNNILVSFEGATKNDCLTKLKDWIKNVDKNHP